MLCSNEEGSSAQLCPVGAGEITGTIMAADILPILTQGVEEGALVDLIRALRAGAAYVNIHSSSFPAGEIRGQIRWQYRSDR